VAEDDDLERRARKLTVDHAETRWPALRLDDDVKEIRDELRTMRTENNARFDSIDRQLGSVDNELDAHGRRLDSIDRTLQDHSARFDSIDRTLEEHSTKFDSIDGELQEHRGRFDSVDAVLRSLTQMVGQVLERLPEERRG
jgi:chromosome segregation ATPase